MTITAFSSCACPIKINDHRLGLHPDEGELHADFQFVQKEGQRFARNGVGGHRSWRTDYMTMIV